MTLDDRIVDHAKSFEKITLAKTNISFDVFMCNADVVFPPHKEMSP